MDNSQLEQRVKDLEQKLAMYERFMTITPTKVILHQSVIVQGLVNADRVYTKRSGSYAELTT